MPNFLYNLMHPIEFFERRRHGEPFFFSKENKNVMAPVYQSFNNNSTALTTNLQQAEAILASPVGVEFLSSSFNQYFKGCLNGDYKMFEKLSEGQKNFVADKMLSDNKNRLHLGDANGNPPFDLNLLEREGLLLNGPFRLALERQARLAATPAERALYTEQIASMSERVFENNFKSVTAEQRSRAEDYYRTIKHMPPAKATETVNTDIAKAQRQNRTMLKLMLLNHLGNRKISQNGQEIEYTGSIASLFTSGSRTAIALPETTNKQQLMDSIFGQNMGRESGMATRTAATHNLVLPRNGQVGFNSFKEEKTKLGTFSDQYGVNIAAGGYGQKGLNGRDPQLNDGSCGHMYCQIRKGSANERPGILFGFESDAPGMVNRLGHKHDFTANPEDISCFGCDKRRLIGDKQDGRKIDISDMNSASLITLLDKFDQAITALQTNPARAQDFENLLSHISGPRMARETLVQTLSGIGVPNNALTSLQPQQEVQRHPIANVLPPQQHQQLTQDPLQQQQPAPTRNADVNL